MNYEYEEAPELAELAQRLIVRHVNIEHVEVENVLFLREKTATPSAYAKCFRLEEHPIGFFTEKKFCIVIYEANCDYFTPNQMTLLLYHELLHIGKRNKLRDHTVKDFGSVLQHGLDWAAEGADVPDILGGEDDAQGR